MRTAGARPPGALHYCWEVFVAAWRDRNRFTAGPLTADEADFAPAALAISRRPVSPTQRVTATVLGTLIVTVIIWAYLSRVDIISSATGTVIANSGTKTISSVETAVVRTINVHEGQSVRNGEALLELDATPFQSDLAKYTALEHSAQLEMARSKALLEAVKSGRPPHLPTLPDVGSTDLAQSRHHLDDQYQDFATRLAQIDQQVEQDAQALQVATDRATIYRNLLNTHDVSQDLWLQREQERGDLQERLIQARRSRATLIAQTAREADDAYVKAGKEAVSSQEDAAHAASEAGWLTLRAPVNGVVQQLTVHTVGAAVATAQALMTIVPNKPSVQIEAYLENRDVGFVQVGQQAQIKVVTYDYTRYGILTGQVVFVSQDAVSAPESLRSKSTPLEPLPRYLVRISVPHPQLRVDGHSDSLMPGMAVNVEIKTGRRRLMEYVLSPILKTGHESLHER
jgi:hemolysin D